ncbi:MAG: crossover junction endodeoxyribonuclease RuvC [Candidatus Margulisbacteria bacterium]|nr:crossover junction endodeoxyribonuclease RuvC [Candidatus Margulisiibacteriota bacterium]
MRILGVDPGIATTGVGIVDIIGHKLHLIYVGAIITKAHTPLSKRLHVLSKSLQELLSRFTPDNMAVEELFFNTNAKTALIVGQARGVILLTGEQYGLDVFGYTPPQVKMAVCGYGRADKNQVQQMVKSLLHMENIPKPDDAADALAVAICHGHSHRLQSLA